MSSFDTLLKLALPLIDYLQQHPHVAWTILFAGALGDATIGFCFFVYGEIFFLAGAVLAGTGKLGLPGVVISCYAGALAGDHLSYWIGRIWKGDFPGLNKLPLLKKGLCKARGLLHHYGDKAVFVARMAGPVAWVFPFLCGSALTPYLRFAFYNFFGVLLGVGQFLLFGYCISSGTTAFFAGKKFLFLWALVPWILGFFLVRKIMAKHKYRTKTLSEECPSEPSLPETESD